MGQQAYRLGLSDWRYQRFGSAGKGIGSRAGNKGTTLVCRWGAARGRRLKWRAQKSTLVWAQRDAIENFSPQPPPALAPPCSSSRPCRPASPALCSRQTAGCLSARRVGSRYHLVELSVINIPNSFPLNAHPATENAKARYSMREKSRLQRAESDGHQRCILAHGLRQYSGRSASRSATRRCGKASRKASIGLVEFGGGPGTICTTLRRVRMSKRVRLMSAYQPATDKDDRV